MISNYVLSALFILYGTAGGGPAEFTVAGGAALLSGIIVQILYRIIPAPVGVNSDFVSDYDRTVIGGCFAAGRKRQLFFNGLKNLREGEYNDAIELFREVKGIALSEEEQGVLGFYTSICYSRMGYPTNAGHAAAIAVEKDVRTPESLLMAARCFSAAGSTSSAEDYYRRLLPLAEDMNMFPFVYNEMGRLFVTANKPEDAKQCFGKAIKNGLDPVTAQAGMALACLIADEIDEACEWYRLALISRIPDSIGFKEYCGQICTAHGYAEDYLDTHLRERYRKKREKVSSQERW